MLFRSIVKVGGKQQIADKRSYGFGQTGKEGKTESILTVAGGIIDRHRNRDTFGDIMDGNGNRNRYSNLCLSPPESIFPASPAKE